MKRYDCIVIGGGISGVTFAQQLSQQQQSVCLIEASSRLGGCINTHTYRDGFWIENGAHTLYNSYHNTIQTLIDQDLTIAIQTRNKAPFFLSDDKRPQIKILTRLNPIMMALGVVRFYYNKRDDLSVSQYFQKIFGRHNYESTLKHCFDAVLCQDSRDFPASFLFKTREKNKNYPRSFTLKNGLRQIFDQSIAYDIHFNTVVATLEKHNDHWKVISADGAEYRAKTICLSTPWHVTQSLLKGINHSIANISQQPKESTITAISLIFDKDKVNLKRFAFNIGIDQNYYSFMSRDVIDHKNYRAMTIYTKEKMNDQQVQSFIETFRQQHNLPQPIDDYHNHYTLPKYATQHDLFLQTVEQDLGDDLYLCGNYFTRLAIEDCILRAKDEVKRYFSVKTHD